MEVIPVIEDPERYENHAFIDSKFIELKSNDIFEINMQYPILRMENAEEQCFVRKEVYEMLIEAAKLLPKGYKFKVLDAWRPFALQNELYNVYSANIIKDFELEQCTDKQKQAVIRKFISDPIEDRDVPPVHTTGGAIDVTLMDQNGIELDMGTAFDAFTDKTSTAFFENEKNELIRDNRGLLYHVMTSVGFTNLPSEWWHFDYGDRFWGYYNQKPAIYRGVFTKEEMDG
jgi:D-alanyl-D-alanine dipeptidase